jgi:hypothetical protein
MAKVRRPVAAGDRPDLGPSHHGRRLTARQRRSALEDGVGRKHTDI